MAEEIMKQEAKEIAEPYVGSVWTSFSADTRDERAKVYDALNDAASLEDHIGERLDVTDVVFEMIEVQDPLTQEMKPAQRTVLICADGSAYASMSTGVEGAMQRLFSIIGQPTWEPPLPLVAEKKPGSKGFKFTTLNLWKE